MFDLLDGVAPQVLPVQPNANGQTTANRPPGAGPNGAKGPSLDVPAPGEASSAMGFWSDDAKPPPADPAKRNADTLQKLGGLDPSKKDSLEQARALLRGVPQDQRAALLASLPPELAVVGYGALPLALLDEANARKSAEDMNAAEKDGKLDALQIRKQINCVPPELREQALAELSPEARKAVEGQLAADTKTVADNGPVLAKMSAIDVHDKDALEKFRAELRQMPLEDRTLLLSNLPREQQMLGFAALPLSIVDETKSKEAVKAISAAGAEGTIDENEIRKNLRQIPPDLREKALAELPADARAQVDAQVAKDAAAVDANKASVEKLQKIDPKNPHWLDDARAALRAAPPEDRLAMLETLPEPQRGLAFAGYGLALTDDLKAKQAIGSMKAAGDKLDEGAIHSNLLAIPKEMRERMLAEMPAESRARIADQLKQDQAFHEKYGAASAAIGAMNKDDPRSVAAARQALHDVPLADRLKLQSSFPDVPLELTVQAVTMANVDEAVSEGAKATLKTAEKLDESTIHEQLRKIPRDMRDKALADLPPEVAGKIKGQLDADKLTVQANLETVKKLNGIDFTKRGSMEQVGQLLADVPPEQRAALIETLPDETHKAGVAAQNILLGQETNAQVGVTLLKKAGEAGVPDDRAIEASLGLMAPATRKKALAELPEETRKLVEAKLEEGKARAAESARLIEEATKGDSVDRKKLLEAMKELPSWEKRYTIGGLSDRAKASADAVLDENAKIDKAKAAFEAGGELERADVKKMMEGIPADRFAEMKGSLSEEGKAAVAKVEQDSADSIQKAIEAQKQLADMPFVGDAAQRAADQSMQDALRSLSPVMRESAIERLPEDMRERAREVTKEVETSEKQVSAAAGEFDVLAKKPPPKAEDDDGQKQFSEQLQDHLAKIPYEHREEALGQMSTEGRALAEQAMATKTAELEEKSATLFKAINAGMLENGTDSSTIYQQLATLTPNERKELSKIYGEQNLDKDGKPRDLYNDLREEFKDVTTVGITTRSFEKDREFLAAVFNDDTVKQKVLALELGKRGSSLTDCTDEELLKKTLESCKTEEEREAVKSLYQDRNHETVDAMLKDEMVTGDVDANDYDYLKCKAYLDGEREKAKSVEMSEAMDPGILGKVSIRQAGALAALVPGVGPLVNGAIAVADATGVIDADRKLAEPDTEKVAGVYAGCKSQAERDRVSEEFEKKEGKSIAGVAEERCPGKYDVKLVEYAAVNDKIGVKAARWMKEGEKMNSDEQRMMGQLEGDQHAEVVARIEKDYGEGSFEKKSKEVFNEREMAQSEKLAKDGKVDAVTGLLATTPKVGTWCLDDISKQLMDDDPKNKGKLRSKKDMEEMKAKYCAELGISEADFDETIDHKLGAKDAFKLRQMLKGEPANRQERLERMREEHEFNRGGASNLAGKLATDAYSTAGGAEDSQMAKLNELNARLDDLEGRKDSLSDGEKAELEQKTKEFETRSGYFGSNVKSYQTSRETLTNDVTTVVATTAGAALTVASAGTLGPVVAAGVGALLAGGVTMAGKEALLGDSYNLGGLDGAKDMMQTACNTALAMGTAGLAPGIDKIGANAASSLGAVFEGPAGKIFGEVLGAGVKGVATGTITGVGGAATGVLTDDKFLQGKGDPMEIAKKLGGGGLSGGVGGAVTGMVGKGLESANLHVADPASTNWSTGSHLANKGLAQVTGDLAGYMVDPANLQGDVLGGFVKKEAVSLPGAAVSMVGEAVNANKTGQKEWQKKAEREIGDPTDVQQRPQLKEGWQDDPQVRQRLAENVAEEQKLQKTAEKYGFSKEDLENPVNRAALERQQAADELKAKLQPPSAKDMAKPYDEQAGTKALAKADQDETPGKYHVPGEETPEQLRAKLQPPSADDMAKPYEEPKRYAGPGDEPTTRPLTEEEAAPTGRHPEKQLPQADGGPEISYREVEGAELKEVHLGIDGAENTAHMKERAKAAVDKLSTADREQYDAAVANAKTNLQQEMVERAMAAGSKLSDVNDMVGRFGNMSDQDILDVFTGKAIIQTSGQSCVPASLQIAIAQADPIFALQMMEKPGLMSAMQRMAMESQGAGFPQRPDLASLPPQVREAIERNPALGAVLDNPGHYTEGTGGLAPGQARDLPLKARLDGTIDGDLKIRTSTGEADAGDGQYSSLPHDEIQKQLAKSGAVAIGAGQHARVITGAFTDEHGNLCYTVRDPETGHPRVMTAAELEAMKGSYVMHEHGSFSDDDLGELADIADHEPVARAQEEERSAPLNAALKELEETAEGRKALSALQGVDLDLSDDGTTYHTTLENGQGAIRIGASRGQANIPAEIVHEATHEANARHEKDLGTTKSDYIAGTASDEAKAYAAEIEQHYEARDAARARGEPYQGKPDDPMTRVYGEAYESAKQQALANGLSEDDAKAYAREAGTQALETHVLDVKPGKEGDERTYRDHASAEWDNANRDAPSHEAPVEEPLEADPNLFADWQRRFEERQRTR